MTRFLKPFICIALSFMCLGTCIGYAALSTPLSIEGKAEVVPPEEIYITKIEMVSSNMTTESSGYFWPTNVESSIKGAKRAAVTYAITVYNNTPYKYAYVGIDYDASAAGYNGNAYINNGITIVTKDSRSDYAATFNSSDSIEPRQSRTFYATYTIANSNSMANKDWKLLVNYKFGLHVDSMGAVAVDSALAKFEDILNDKSEGGGYATLIDKIDDKYDGTDWKANYIGNVVDSSGADTATIEGLFDGKLSLKLNNVETNVTVLIKREDVDGNLNTGDSYTARYGYQSVSESGCEMTLYMTTDKLQSGTPVVYAAVFTCNVLEDGSYGDWYMIGDLYSGTARIVGYEGEETSGSFDTGTWRSSAASYTVADNYHYNISRNNTIQTVTQARDNNAISVLQPLLNDANDLINGKYGLYAGDAMVALEAAFNEASRCYTVNADGSVTVNSTATRSQLIPLIKEMNAALVPFENILKNG